MDFIIQFQLNIFSLLVLFVLYNIIRIRTKIKSFGCKLINYTVLFTAFALVIEPLTWAFDGVQTNAGFFMEYLTNFLLLLIAPIICGFMLSFVDYYIYKDIHRIQKRFYYMHFLGLTFIVLIINIFYPLYFAVDSSTSAYTVGDYAWVNSLIIFLFYIYMIIVTLKNRKRIAHNAVNIFIFIFSIPIIGMVIQLYNKNIFFSWTSIVLSILVVYVFLESVNGEIDYLTKLYSRRSYEKYVNKLIETDKQFQIIFIDLNKFKEINDKYGHLKGDKVLIDFSFILKKAFSPNILVSRLGGDEYMIVDEYDLDVKNIVDELHKHMKDSPVFNGLTFSYGCEAYKPNMSIDDLYGLVDKKMYLNKNIK